MADGERSRRTQRLPGQIPEVRQLNAVRRRRHPPLALFLKQLVVHLPAARLRRHLRHCDPAQGSAEPSFGGRLRPWLQLGEPGPPERVVRAEAVRQHVVRAGQRDVQLAVEQ